MAEGDALLFGNERKDHLPMCHCKFSGNVFANGKLHLNCYASYLELWLNFPLRQNYTSGILCNAQKKCEITSAISVAGVELHAQCLSQKTRIS